MMASRPKLLCLCLSLLVGLVSFTACNSAATGGGGGTTQSGTPSGGIATATVDLSDLSKLLMLSHEKGPQDVTYVYTSTVTSSQGTAQGSGKATFTRTPQRFLLDITFPTASSLNRHQTYDYDSKKITSTVNGQPASTTTNIEPYYLLHSPVLQGKEQVNGAEAYHISGTLCQNTLCIQTHLWMRTADLYVVKITQHAEGNGITDDLAYTDPAFNTGATIPAP
jgi:hypothetical protein